MRLVITYVEDAPEELHEQIPIAVELLRELPGPDRADYWLGRVRTPIRWLDEGRECEITHIVVGARLQAARIAPGVRDLPINIAYVVEPSQVDEERLDFNKCAYVAIGAADETGEVSCPTL